MLLPSFGFIGMGIVDLISNWGKFLEGKNLPWTILTGGLVLADGIGFCLLLYTMD